MEAFLDPDVTAEGELAVVEECDNADCLIEGNLGGKMIFVLENPVL